MTENHRPTPRQAAAQRAAAHERARPRTGADTRPDSTQDSLERIADLLYLIGVAGPGETGAPIYLLDSIARSLTRIANALDGGSDEYSHDPVRAARQREGS